MFAKHSNLIICYFCFIFKEYCNALSETVSLDIYLMNGQKISLKIVSTDSTDDVLEVSYLAVVLYYELCDDVTQIKSQHQFSRSAES